MIIDILEPESTPKMIKMPEDHHRQLTRFCENRGIEEVSNITFVENQTYPTYIIHADEDYVVEIIDNRVQPTGNPDHHWPIREDTSFKETPGLNKALKFEAPQGMTKDIKYVLTRTPITEILEEEDKNIFRALIEASNRLMFLEHLENHPAPCPQCQSKNICMTKGDFTCQDCGMQATVEISFKKIPDCLPRHKEAKQ